MSFYEKLLEKQNIFWTIVIGIAIAIFGVYYFFEIKTLEETGGDIRLNLFFYPIYKIGGKILILVATEIIGIGVFISGLIQAKGLFDKNKKS